MPWSHIIGHDAWVTAFRHVASRGRLAHAYLFVGPEGVGKKLFAVELGKTLLCEKREPANFEACGECESCRYVDARTHPDFFLWTPPWIDPEDGEEKNVLPINLMRVICEGFGLKSARGRGKVAIVDDADDLSEESANCFLKTLEEPPAGSTIILIGKSPEAQLPTIRSRCQTVRFAPLSTALVESLLKKAEGVDPAQAPRLARLADGSPGQARRLAEPELWAFRSKLLAAVARPKFNSVTLAKEFVEFAEEAGKETKLHRARAKLVMTLLLAAIRDAVRVGLGDARPASSAEEAQLLEALSRRAGPEKWAAVVDRCLEAEIQLDRYIQVGLVLEGLLDALSQSLDG